MRKLLPIFLGALLCFFGKVSAQTVTLLTDDFETTSNAANTAGSGGTWTRTNVGTLAFYPYNLFVIQSGCTPIAGTQSMHLTGIASSSSVTCAYQNISATNNPGFAAIVYKQVNATGGLSNVKVSYKWKGVGEAGNDYGNLVYTTDLTGASGWTVVGANLQGSASATTVTDQALPASLDNSQFLLGWKFTANASVVNSPGLDIDDVSVTATAPAAPLAVGAITASQITGGVEKGSTNNVIIGFKIPITGTTGTLTLTGLNLTSGNTNDANITNVKLWSGTASSLNATLGSATFSGGSANITGLSQSLVYGDNYFWVSYDIALASPFNNILDASIGIGGITIVAAGGATAPGTQPPSALNPSGSRKVDYCLNDFPSDREPITLVNFAGIDNTSSAALTSPPAQEDFTSIVGTVTAGQTYPIRIKGNTGGNYSDSVVVFIDWNRDGFLTGANEKYSIGSLVNTTGTDAVELTGNIAVPATAINGTTRMRVIKKYSSGTPPPVVTSCNVAGFGQTEDYSLTVSGGLPVTFLSFSGETRGLINKLNWSTATEINNSGFEIQRSANGNEFSTIATVASKGENGNSTNQLNYSFDDVKPLAGTNYYRLKQVDKDGKYSYSSTIALKNDVRNIEISAIYPNPVKDKLNLSIVSPRTEKVTIAITDIAGKMLQQITTSLIPGDNNIKLDVNRLTSGAYYVRVITADEVKTSRFIKN